jgi:hypothetical protein
LCHGIDHLIWQKIADLFQQWASRYGKIFSHHQHRRSREIEKKLTQPKRFSKKQALLYIKPRKVAAINCRNRKTSDLEDRAFSHSQPSARLAVAIASGSIGHFPCYILISR